MVKDAGMRISFHDQIASNKRNSIFLIIIIFAVFLALGYVISQIYNPELFFVIMIIAIILSILYIMLSYYNSDKIAIASVKAKKASREKYPQYYHSVEGLCLASGMPMSKLYVMEGCTNELLFASGRRSRNIL